MLRISKESRAAQQASPHYGGAKTKVTDKRIIRAIES